MFYGNCATPLRCNGSNTSSWCCSLILYKALNKALSLIGSSVLLLRWIVAKINLLAGGLTMIATLLVAQLGINYIAYMKLIYPVIQLKYLPSIKSLMKYSGRQWVKSIYYQ